MLVSSAVRRSAVRELRSKCQGSVRAAERGLTIIELLMVLTIIGVLSAIALPQILSYRQTAFDAQAKSDLRNAANAQEAFFLGMGDYLDCTNADCVSQLPNFRLSNTVSIRMQADNGAQPAFTGTAYSNGGKRTFTYDSAGGGLR
jgi:type IV pilus assembly protein PilA